LGLCPKPHKLFEKSLTKNLNRTARCAVHNGIIYYSQNRAEHDFISKFCLGTGKKAGRPQGGFCEAKVLKTFSKVCGVWGGVPRFYGQREVLVL